MEQFLIHYLEHYGLLAILASFAIGIITALAPCSILTLPLLVGSALGLSQDLGADAKKRFILKYSLLFVLGIIISFSLLMLLVAKVGILLSVAPLWAYALAALATWSVVLYALGVFGSFDKGAIAQKLLRFKLFGALLIGLIFGLVSSPCASAPLVAIITTTEQVGWFYAYILVLAFAFGHSMLLLLAGISLGFAQRIASNKKIAKISTVVNNFFILILALIACYFTYQSLQGFIS